MSAPNLSDEELAKQFLAGKTSAFETLVQRYAKPVYNFALNFLGDADEADEVLDLATADIVDHIPEDDFADEDAIEDDDTIEDVAPLVTEAARVSMRDNLAALALLSEPSMPPQIVRSGETSLEGLTRELLRPVLSEWLDKNLPEMVERLVKDEIARIAGKRG